DARQPLGLAVVGGLVVSQILTLYITPVLYLYLERLQVWLKREHVEPQLDGLYTLNPEKQNWTGRSLPLRHFLLKVQHNPAESIYQGDLMKIAVKGEQDVE